MMEKVLKARKLVGAVLDPYAAYALGRGLKTLAVRVERQNASALAVARELERRGTVERVYYPGLESHPDHAIAKRQMSGFGGMVCLDVGGGYARAARVLRSPADRQARRQPRRRREPLQPARAHVAVGTLRRGARARRRDRQHGAAVHRPRGSRRPHRRSGTGAQPRGSGIADRGSVPRPPAPDPLSPILIPNLEPRTPTRIRTPNAEPSEPERRTLVLTRQRLSIT